MRMPPTCRSGIAMSSFFPHFSYKNVEIITKQKFLGIRGDEALRSPEDGQGDLSTGGLLEVVKRGDRLVLPRLHQVQQRQPRLPPVLLSEKKRSRRCQIPSVPCRKKDRENTFVISRAGHIPDLMNVLSRISDFSSPAFFRSSLRILMRSRRCVDRPAICCC